MLPLAPGVLVGVILTGVPSFSHTTEGVEYGVESSSTWPISKERVTMFPFSYVVLLSVTPSPSPVLATIRSDPSVLEPYAVNNYSKNVQNEYLHAWDLCMFITCKCQSSPICCGCPILSSALVRPIIRGLEVVHHQ